MNYLISAESYRLIDKEIKKIVKDNNYIIFNMSKCSIKEVIEEASYFGLGIDEKWIVASNATFFGTEKLSEEDNNLLLNYLNNPNPSSHIIFTTLNGIDSKKRIVKCIKEKGHLINISKMDKRALNEVLNAYLKNYNYSMDYKTVNYIMDNSFKNLDIMFNELDKVMLYYGFPCDVKYNDVVKIVGEEKTNNNFLFVDAVINKDLGKAIKIFNNLKIYKVDATSLVILLAREYRLMYYVKTLYNKLGINGLIDYLHMQEWQINKLYNNGLKYTNNELLDNLVSLSNIDVGIKKGLLDKDTSLISFLMDTCN